MFFILVLRLTRGPLGVLPAGRPNLRHTGTENAQFHINLDQPTIAKGYTVAAFDDAIKLSLAPGILADATDVDVPELNEDMPMPWQLDQASPVYQFEFMNKQAYDNRKPFYIQMILFK